MKLRNLTLAFSFLKVKNLSPYFSTKIIINAFVGALMLSNFIYFSLFESKILNFISPFITILGIFIIIYSKRSGFFMAGFFTGILWFYWIGFSFYYYGLGYLMLFVVFGIGLVYGLIFWVASFPSFVFLRAVMLFLVSYIAPFGFNWLNLEATLVLGIFEPSTKGLIFIFLGAFCLGLRKWLKFIAIFPLIFAVQITTKEPNFVPFELFLSETDVKQKQKWDSAYKDVYINESLSLINLAINEGKRAILLPENAFAAFIDHEPNLMKELKILSQNITIITGGLAYENKHSYNSAYLYEKGEVRRFDKLVLVPFGEEIPLPNFIKKIINELFFNGASDFKTANGVSDYEIDGVMIRNAICYEATTDKIYENSPNIVFAITNNGWFKIGNFSSTEPALQRLLLKYYSTKYGTTIYHSVNGSKSEIITPKRAVLEIFGK